MLLGLTSFKTHEAGQPYADSIELPAVDGINPLRGVLIATHEIQEGCPQPCDTEVDQKVYKRKIELVAQLWGELLPEDKKLTEEEIQQVVEHYMPRRHNGSSPPNSPLEAAAVESLSAGGLITPRQAEAVMSRAQDIADALMQGRREGRHTPVADDGSRLTSAQRQEGVENYASTPGGDSRHTQRLATGLPPGATTGAEEKPSIWRRIGDLFTTSPLANAYGITVRVGGDAFSFRDPVDAVNYIQSVQGPVIEEVTLYGHGAPGLIILGEEYLGPGDTISMLQGRLAPGAKVHLVGCNTASIGEASLNPLRGLSSLVRRAGYYTWPLIREVLLEGKDPDQSRRDNADYWDQDLAREVSAGLPGAQICGFRTFGLVPSRIPFVSTLMGTRESATPGAVGGSKACYTNGVEG